MGRDNQPKKRQERALARKSNKRRSYDRILIVTEGLSEKLYFDEIRQVLRLSQVYIKVVPSSKGTAPLQIVESAKEILLKSKSFERVFCVFDRDEHLDFENAIKSANAQNEKYVSDSEEMISFRPIVSIPSFELWLLIHFECVTKPLHRKVVESMLKKHIIGYEKGKKGVFLLTSDLLNTAFRNADIMNAEALRIGRKDPFTEVDRLVKLLMELKRF